MSKNYGGILDHEKRGEIDSLIIELKLNNIGLRVINNELKSRYGIDTSHTTLASYYKEKLRGDELDKFKEEKEKQMEQVDGTSKPYINEEVLSKLMDKHGTTEKGKMYANILALASSNLEAFKDGKERIKLELMKYLKDMEAIYKGG
mgnify:CR=1 FL=1